MCKFGLIVWLGLRDNVTDGDRFVEFSLVATSEDPVYSGRIVTFVAINRDIQWPAMSAIAPLALPALGSRVTIRGRGLKVGAVAFVGTQRAYNETVYRGDQVLGLGNNDLQPFVPVGASRDPLLYNVRNGRRLATSNSHRRQ